MWLFRVTLAEPPRSFQAPFGSKPASSITNRLLNKRLSCQDLLRDTFPPNILPLLEPSTKMQTGWGQNSQESPMWSTILPGFGPDLFPLHGCLAPAGSRALVSLSVALHPTLIGVEVTTTGMTSYVNVCRPESTKRTAELPSSSRPRVSRHEQTVKYYPGKPVIATSSSFWHSVVKLRTWRETEMLPGWKMCL